MPKFWRKSISEFHFLPAVAASNLVPTTLEIAAGIDLSLVISEINGWDLSNAKIETPNLKETFTANLPGADSVADSSVMIYDDDTDTTTRAALAKGTNGFVLWAPYGNVSGKRGEVFPVRIAVVSDEKTTGADQAARYSVGFAVTKQPNINVTLP